jgi:hypothetical protein
MTTELGTTLNGLTILLVIGWMIWLTIRIERLDRDTGMLYHHLLRAVRAINHRLDPPSKGVPTPRPLSLVQDDLEGRQR